MKEVKLVGFNNWLGEGGKGKREVKDYFDILSFNNEKV